MKIERKGEERGWRGRCTSREEEEPIEPFFNCDTHLIPPIRLWISIPSNLQPCVYHLAVHTLTRDGENRRRPRLSLFYSSSSSCFFCAVHAQWKSSGNNLWIWWFFAGSFSLFFARVKKKGKKKEKTVKLLSDEKKLWKRLCARADCIELAWHNSQWMRDIIRHGILIMSAVLKCSAIAVLGWSIEPTQGSWRSIILGHEAARGIHWMMITSLWSAILGL